jgi:phosphatidylglycerophosphatase A
MLSNFQKEKFMSIESTRPVIMRYFNSEYGDMSMMADDVVFAIMATG